MLKAYIVTCAHIVDKGFRAHLTWKVTLAQSIAKPSHLNVANVEKNIPMLSHTGFTLLHVMKAPFNCHVWWRPHLTLTHPWKHGCPRGTRFCGDFVVQFLNGKYNIPFIFSYYLVSTSQFVYFLLCIVFLGRNKSVKCLCTCIVIFHHLDHKLLGSLTM